jgi:hypothetical protein
VERLQGRDVERNEAMTDMFLVMGWLTAICAGWMLILLALIALLRMSNFIADKVMDRYGGWQSYFKFREWYWQQPENKEKK